ncbi:MAG: hypothetical protein C4334_11845 [Pyrinomonas sp.]
MPFAPLSLRPSKELFAWRRNRAFCCKIVHAPLAHEHSYSTAPNRAPFSRKAFPPKAKNERRAAISLQMGRDKPDLFKTKVQLGLGEISLQMGRDNRPPLGRAGEGKMLEEC